MVLDLAILQISYILVYYLRFHDFVYFSQKYRNLGILLFLTDLLIIVLNNSLHDVIKRSYIKELIEFGKHCLYVFAVVLFYPLRDWMCKRLQRCTKCLNISFRHQGKKTWDRSR